jgi:hypothetical protein
MSETIRITTALLAVASLAGFVAAYERVCHALRIALAALVVLFAGLFYGSALTAACGALTFIVGCLVALGRWAVLRRAHPVREGLQ